MTQSTDNLTGAHTQRELGADTASAGKVKPLLWKAHDAKYDGGRSHYGTGIFGHWYCASRAQNREWLLMHHVGGKPCHFSPFPSLDAAKAAAQADYEARILAALELVAQLVAQEPVEGAPVDLWFTDRSLPVLAMSIDAEDSRVLRVHFRRDVTKRDRDDLIAAMNLYAHPATPAPVEAGLREAINALKPFSEACEQVDTKGNPDTAGFIGAGLTLGDLRAARRTLAALRAQSAPVAIQAGLADRLERAAAMMRTHKVAILGADELDAAARALRAQSAPAAGPSQAALDVLAERQRQISAEGWTLEHDDRHDRGEMPSAAACYALAAAGFVMALEPAHPPKWWPWSAAWWKPKDARANLVRASALCIAEIERIDRAAPVAGEGGEG